MNYARLMDRIKKDEGFRPRPYWDNDQWTVGYGTKAKDAQETITERDAEARLANELTVALHDCHILFPKYETFDAVRAEALANMAFNLGRSKLGRFYCMLRAINVWEGDPDWERAAQEALDSKWRHQVGKRALRIAEELRTGEIADEVT